MARDPRDADACSVRIDVWHTFLLRPYRIAAQIAEADFPERNPTNAARQHGKCSHPDLAIT